MKSRSKMLLLLVLFSLLALMVGYTACRGDDDDDNDDNNTIDDDDNDNDDNDNDTGDDDDDDTGGLCEGYDLTVEGLTSAPTGDMVWKAYLNIDIPTGAITGMIDPEGDEMDPYNVTGLRHDSQTGELEGSFPTPATIPSTMCEAETVYNHMDFVVVTGNMTGEVEFYCGDMSIDTLIFTLDTNGTVTCGNFAM